MHGYNSYLIASDGVSLLSWGYSLILAIPAAFVELAPPLSTNRERTPPVRLRIISAGVYHNLITLLVLSLVPIISSDRIIWLVLGYRDIGSGVVVVDVDMVRILASFRYYLNVLTDMVRSDMRLDITLIEGFTLTFISDSWVDNH